MQHQTLTGRWDTLTSMIGAQALVSPCNVQWETDAKGRQAKRIFAYDDQITPLHANLDKPALLVPDDQLRGPVFDVDDNTYTDTMREILQDVGVGYVEVRTRKGTHFWCGGSGPFKQVSADGVGHKLDIRIPSKTRSKKIFAPGTTIPEGSGYSAVTYQVVSEYPGQEVTQDTLNSILLAYKTAVVPPAQEITPEAPRSADKPAGGLTGKSAVDWSEPPLGEGHKSLISHIGALRRANVPFALALDLLHRWVSTWSDPMDQKEVRRQLDSGYSQWEPHIDVIPTYDNTAGKPFFTLVRDIEIRPPDWLVKGQLESNVLAMIFGPPEAGKSFFAVDLTCCIGTGTPWADGRPVKRGKVAYIAGEGTAGLRRRFEAWGKSHGVDPMGDVYLSSGAAALSEPDQVAMVADSLKALPEPPVLIIVDTLSRNSGGADENSTKDMALLVRHLDYLRESIGATVLLVHHSGLSDKDRARGSSVINAAMDFAYMVARKPDGYTVIPSKVKDHARPPAVHFKLEGVHLEGDTNSAVPIYSGHLSSDTKPLPPTQQQLLDLLETPSDEAGNLNGMPIGVVGVDYDTLRDLWVKQGYRRQGYSETIKKAVAGGLIEHRDGFVTRVKVSD